MEEINALMRINFYLDEYKEFLKYTNENNDFFIDLKIQNLNECKRYIEKILKEGYILE